MNQQIKLSLALSAISFSSMLYALPDDQSQPMQIEADKAYYNQNTGIAIYEGNVIASQGSIKIEADYIKVTSNTETNRFNRLDAKGGPAKFRQQIDDTGSMMVSEGDSILYLTTEELLEITGQGYVKRAGDEIRADFIKYRMDNGTFEAEKQTSGRVSMTLVPEETPTEEPQ